MPINSIHGKALDAKKRLMLQVFAGEGNEAGGADEDRRRRTSAQAASSAAVPRAPQESNVPATSAAQKISPPPPISAIIDRVHKEAGGPFGGYVIVARDHDGSEADQMPPSNPGWRTLGVNTSSIADAYAKAQVMQALLKQPYGRVAIVILGGVWTEDLNINIPGIDFCGIGKPTIIGTQSIGIKADSRFYDLDFIGTVLLSVYPADTTTPRPIPTSFWCCRLYSDTTCLVSMRRFYAEHCEFYQTADQTGAPTETAAIRLFSTGPQSGFCILKDCKLFAYYDYSAFAMYGIQPRGFAIHVIAGVGSFAIRDGWYMTPSTGVVLDQCEVYGSLINENWVVEHKGGRQHGGIKLTARTGNVYLLARGLPLFDSSGAYYGSSPSYTTFDCTSIHSELIGQFVPSNATYPTGVSPSTYPGICYVAIRHTPHLARYDGGLPAQPFLNATGGSGTDAIVDVVNASTAATTWISALTTTTLYGTCPAGVNGNLDFFMM